MLTLFIKPNAQAHNNTIPTVLLEPSITFIIITVKLAIIPRIEIAIPTFIILPFFDISTDKTD